MGKRSGLGDNKQEREMSTVKQVRRDGVQRKQDQSNPDTGAIAPTASRKVDVRLPEIGNSNSHAARPVHHLITMITWIRTSRLSIKKFSLHPEAEKSAHRSLQREATARALSLSPTHPHSLSLSLPRHQLPHLIHSRRREGGRGRVREKDRWT